MAWIRPTSRAWLRSARPDKFPVPVAGTPGFLVNRVLFPYLLEAATAYAEGIPGPVLDKTAVKFGMPMGPIELIDTVGLDVAAGVGAELAPFLRLPIPAALATVEAGKRGRRTARACTSGRTDAPSNPRLPAVTLHRRIWKIA